ncbi:hypothetical protein [Algicella marina]|uniref:EF-hand domain-containing protein n=1 Tax=Algicella marina TaxID=2683284 RepID=A0A6P1SZ80_9RHOB|nr:hypothetical protein [Algicella marina]QHQ35994.1 hypothetical protein GO499_12835 [Algicella marina]
MAPWNFISRSRLFVKTLLATSLAAILPATTAIADTAATMQRTAEIAAASTQNAAHLSGMSRMLRHRRNGLVDRLLRNFFQVVPGSRLTQLRIDFGEQMHAAQARSRFLMNILLSGLNGDGRITTEEGDAILAQTRTRTQA